MNILPHPFRFFIFILTSPLSIFLLIIHTHNNTPSLSHSLYYNKQIKTLRKAWKSRRAAPS